MDPANAKFVCGGECGINTVGTPSNGTEHWSNFGAGVTVVTSGPSPMRSTRCFRCNASASTSGMEHTFATAIASGGTAVGRLYIYFATLPGGTSYLPILTFHGYTSTNYYGAWYDPATGTIRAGRAYNIAATGGIAITTDTWYRVEVKVSFASPHTVDVKVATADGAASDATQLSHSIAAETCDRFMVVDANISPYTFDAYVTGIVASGTAGDWPIGPGKSVGLYPNGDRTNTQANPDDGNGGHVYDATTDFGKGSGGGTNLGAQNAESTSWQSLAKPLSANVATNFIADKTGSNAQHLVWTLDDLPAEASAINGVMAVATTHSASSTGNNQSLAYLSTTTYSHRITLWGALDLSEATITVPCAIAPTAATQFALAWTPTLVNATVIAWGDSSDVNPDPYLDGVCLEVDYIGGPSNVELTLTPAALTVAAQALTIAAGGISLELSPATISITAQPLTITNLPPPITLTADPATINITAQPLSISVGGVSLTAAPATVTVAAQPLTISAGGVALDLTPATATIQAQPLTASAAVAVSTAPATLNLTAQPLTLVAGDTALALSPATVTLEAQPLTIDIAQPIALTLGTASITMEAVPLALAMGPVAIALTAAEISITAQQVEISTVQDINFTLDAATITIAAVQLEIACAVALDLTSASVEVTAQPVALALGDTAIDLTPATITLEARPVILSMAGAIEFMLEPATLQISAAPLALTMGAIALDVGTAELALAAQPLTLAAATALTLAPATVTLGAQPLAVTAAVALDIVPAEVSISPVALEITGAMALALTPAALTISATPLTATYGPATLDLQPATIQITAVGVSITQPGSPIEFTLEPAVLTLVPNQLSLAAAVALALPPAALTVAATPLTIAAATALNLTAAGITLNANQLTVVAGPCQLTMGTGILQVAAVPLEIAPGPCALVLTPAQIALLAVALPGLTMGPAALDLQPALITIRGNVLRVIVGVPFGGVILAQLLESGAVYVGYTRQAVVNADILHGPVRIDYIDPEE